MKKLRKLANGGTAHSGWMTPPMDIQANPHTGKSGFSGNTPEMKRQTTLQPTSKENATLEAELGETVVTDLSKQGLPEFFKIGGKPHSKGGTPLNLPENSFIFSRDKNLKIQDRSFLDLIGWSGKKNPTVAEVSKKFDTSPYLEILANSFSSKLQKETAEKMIANYAKKLGALALYQESLKGFDGGIPAIAIPFMEEMGLTGESFFPKTETPGSSFAQFQGGGENKKKRKVRIKNVPEILEERIIPPVSEQPTKYQNIPKDAVKWDPSKEGFVKEDVEPGDFILDNGKWFKVTGYDKAEYTGSMSDPRLGAFNSDYFLLEQQFEDPEFSKAFVENYRKVLNETKPGKNLTAEDLDQARKMSDDQVINTFLYKQKQNFAVGLLVDNLSKESKAGDKKLDWDRNRELARTTANKAGFPPLSNYQIAAFQAGYIGLKNMAQDPKFKNKLGAFELIQSGRGDEDVSGTMGDRGTGKGTISQVDGWDGDTTSGQLVVRAASELKKEEVPWIEQTIYESPNVKHLNVDNQKEDPAKWWTQDLNNMGNAFADYTGVKKYYPWQGMPEFTPASPTFTDFRGSAARIGSMVNSGAQNAAAFASPQGFSSMFANMQASAVDPILQTQEAENRANVGVANQFEMFNSQAANQYSMFKAGLDTELFDKTVATNQSFDNAKRAFRHSLKDSFNNAWTNRGKTHSMNKLFPDYAVDPTTGFTVHNSSNRPIQPEAAGSDTRFSDHVAHLMKQNPGLTWEQAIKLAKGNQGIPDTEGLGVTAEQLNYYPGQ